MGKPLSDAIKNVREALFTKNATQVVFWKALDATCHRQPDSDDRWVCDHELRLYLGDARWFVAFKGDEIVVCDGTACVTHEHAEGMYQAGETQLIAIKDVREALFTKHTCIYG